MRSWSYLAAGIATAVLVGMAAAVPPAAAAEFVDLRDLPQEDRDAVKAPLDELVRGLADERNDKDIPYKRGIYSRLLRKVDEGTYEVSFHRDTASEDRLKTERLTLTLKKEGGGTWSIAGEKVEDTREDLIRSVAGDETFHKFDAFSFEREGLKVTAGPGFLYMDYLDGKPGSMDVVADNLTYSYTVPDHAGIENQAKYEYFVKRSTARDDLVFEPDYLYLSCTPQECERLLQESFEGLQDARQEDAPQDLLKEYRDDQKQLEERRKKSPFSGFRTPYPEDQKIWRVALRRKGGREHWLSLAQDNHRGWDVSLSASGYGTLLAYYSEEVLAEGLPPDELERRGDGLELYYDLRKVQGRADLALEDPETMEGDITYDIHSLRRLDMLPFFIVRFVLPGADRKNLKSPDLVLHAVQDGEGNDLTWTRLGGSGGIIYFPEPVDSGKDFRIRLVFSNGNAIMRITPSYSLVARSGWLPFVQFGDFLDAFDLTVRVPARFKAIAVGKKVSESRQGDLAVTRWVSSSPVNFPTVIFGDYVEDKASVQAKKLDGTPIPVHIHVDKFAMGDWEIRPKQLRPLADQAANSINLFANYFGVDYPFDKMDLVNDPLGFLYGQSPASIIYLGSGVFRGEGFMGTLGGADITKFLKDVVPHEVGHQWWGNCVANANSRNYWFVESLAEYASALYVEASNSDGGKRPERGWKAYLDKVEDWRRNILEAGLYGSVQEANVVNTGGYTAAVYAKGPYAFHILRMTFGSEKLHEFLKNLAQKLTGKEIVTRDMQRIAEETFGGTMEWFFDQWIRGVGIPQYSFNYSTRRTESGEYIVEGTVRQRVVVGNEKIPIPSLYYRGVTSVTVVGRKTQKEYAARILVEGPETPFRFKVPEEPRDVFFNKNGEVLAHDILVNEGW